VFSCRKDDDGSNIYYAHLLDFDYAGKDGEERYPEGYNTTIPEGRHPDAKGGEALRCVHDRYAMSQCISTFCDGCDGCDALCRRIAYSEESLETIGEEMKTLDFSIDCTDHRKSAQKVKEGGKSHVWSNDKILDFAF
jgi:hypothetical protein